MRCVHREESVCFPGPLPGGCCIRPTPPGPSQPPLLSQQDMVCPLGPGVPSWASQRVCVGSAGVSSLPGTACPPLWAYWQQGPLQRKLFPSGFSFSQASVLCSLSNTGSWQSCYTEQLQFSLRCVIMLTESDATCSSNTDCHKVWVILPTFFACRAWQSSSK